MVPPRSVPCGRRAAATAAVLGLLIAAPAAGATTLGLDQRCYVTGEQAWISGSGFLPRTPLTFTRAGEPVPATEAATDNSGAFRRTLLVPEVPEGKVESQVEITASDGTSTGRAYLNIARVTASFAPMEGDLRTLRVSHVVSGFGLAEARPSIYLHYVSPAAQRAAQRAASTGGATATASAQQRTGGSTVATTNPPGVRTIRLGLLRGPCGVLRTSPRKLFPFKVTGGTWLLQYDTRPRYTRGTAGSSFLWVSRTVKIGGSASRARR